MGEEEDDPDRLRAFQVHLASSPSSTPSPLEAKALNRGICWGKLVFLFLLEQNLLFRMQDAISCLGFPPRLHNSARETLAK